MSSLECDDPGPKIFEWLESAAGGSPGYYLIPLHLTWRDQGIEHDLEVFRAVSSQLAKEPDYWASCIRYAGWRHSLAACTCLLVSKNTQFFEDLCYRFQHGSWVTPQIAVTLGLLHAEQCRPFLTNVLKGSTEKLDFKTLASANEVLQRLGTEVDLPPLPKEGFEQEDVSIAKMVVKRHWDFWSGRLCLRP